MKKLLLILFCVVSFTAVAQKTYTIDRQLQLENVAPGIKKDSVLVRGSDKIIRYVPRSEFGGGSQNLDQVLANGNTSHESIQLIDNVFAVTDSTGAYLTYLSNFSEGIGEIGIGRKSGLGWSNSRIIQNPLSAIGNYVMNMPVSLSGDTNKTLATTDNITMQKVLETGSYGDVTSPDGFGNATLQATVIDGYNRAGFKTMLNTAGQIKTNAVFASGGVLDITQGYSPDNGVTNYNTQISAVLPTTNAVIKFPAPAVEGAYELALKEDVTLQKAMTNGALWIKDPTFETENNSWFAFGEDTPDNSLNSKGQIKMVVNDDEQGTKELNVDGDGFSAISTSLDGLTNIALSINSVYGKSITYQGDTNRESGTYVLATQNDIAIKPNAGNTGISWQSEDSTSLLLMDDGIQFNSKGKNIINVNSNSLSMISTADNSSKISIEGYIPEGATPRQISYILPTVNVPTGTYYIATKDSTVPKAASTGEYQIYGTNSTGDPFMYEFPTGSFDSVWGTDAYGNVIAERAFDKTTMNSSSSSVPSSAAVINYIEARRIENSTTTALTSTDLNSVYSTASPGYRVIASSVSGGGLIYEKTSTGWIQYAVTIVP